MAKNTFDKDQLTKLKETLCYDRQSLATTILDDEINTYSENYKKFLDSSKTEREAVVYAVELLKQNGYSEYHFGDKMQVGGKYYLNNRGKSIMAFRVGKNLEEGIKLVGSHIDSPRLDIKQNPLYQSDDMAFLKTHYYGGIRKYQWTTIPLALHGTIIKKDGSQVDVKIGDSENDPIFCITDLLPHLAKDQVQKPLGSAFSGEGLNILVGTESLSDEDKEGVKLNVLNLLNQKYGITETDFLSAELCAVPAQNARDLGFDRSMISGYGHDDRVCSYPALTSLINSNGSQTAVCLLADKEETGSDGVTGSQCTILQDLIDELCSYFKANKNIVRMNSVCLSADVTAAYDPLYPEVYEKNNATYLNGGVALCKFTGSRGKGGTSDASCELVGKVRMLFDKNNIVWQLGELGKVDQGGGGTIAKYVANHNIDTIDIGVPVLSMHSPLEVISKKDLYETYKAFVCFYND